ncbi:50S ribosomal protein L11 methyltransferase [Pontibaca methylaminivorans]|uniref:50S ribosomal protein L11 methyltransferase n=1 Tax=Pontibaca methylaminivorans TaxID=515897 RepID=UPI002FD9D5C3
MPVFTALTTLPDEARAAALGTAMERMEPAPVGVGVFELEDGSGLWEVGGYFEAEPDAVALALLAAAFDARPFTVSELPETDWVAHVRRELAPVRAGRFWVHGSHDAGREPEDCVPLRIEAAMAFGTGHHGTTLGCLLMLEQLAAGADAPDPRCIIDVGSGTAVLAMAAAHLWESATIIASDIDPVAVEVARANLGVNGLSGRIACVEAAGLAHPDLAACAPFDLILANILKGPLLALAPDFAARLAPGGHAILSGILTDQAAGVAQRYAQAGFTELSRMDLGDWTTLLLRRDG